MHQKQFRAPAVPLITHDPMFSLWSFATNLTDDTTRHWDGVRKYIFGLVSVDGILYEFLGTVAPNMERYYTGFRKLPQTGCTIRPMTTAYTFENSEIALELTFTSPLLLNDLMILSRPLSYISYKITAMDGRKHDVQLHFGFSGEFCVNENTQAVSVGLTPYSIYFTSGTDQMLRRCGDDHRIEWGSFHVVAPDFEQNAMSLRSYQTALCNEYSNKMFYTNPINSQGPRRERKGPASYTCYEPETVHPYYPTITLRKNLSLDAQPIEGYFGVAYDDVKSIQYFGENIDAYWKKDGEDFPSMVCRAMREYGEVMEKVRLFEDDLLEQANRVSPRYADLLSLAYRQTIAGHKLTWHDGELQFFSKENYSNGCIGTVDVTYPSIPLFLLYAPELVEGMLNPIFKMCEKGIWPYEYAPHDVGTYPLANGQVYGFSFFHRNMRPDPADSQMPVEECGNMILCVAAACFKKHDISYFLRHRAILTKWADYLMKVGYDPDNQLCTDDFAGHLAHNCNLSAKAICALAAFSRMLKESGLEQEAESYGQAARDAAAKWETAAFDGDHYRLTFDQPGTWSLKYNMVWDKLFRMNLFSEKVYEAELSWYKKVMNRYGIPLDSRGDYTKTDWELWSTKLFDDDAYTNTVVDAIWESLCDTPDRVPFPDLVFTSDPIVRSFHARTVQGGLFIQLLNF